MSELGLLREVGAGRGPSDDELAEARSHARHRLRAAIAREQQPGLWARLHDALVVQRAAVAGVAAAVAAVVVVGVAITALRPPAATARLDRLAVVAERAQQPLPTGAEALYVRAQVTELTQEPLSNGDLLSFLAVRRIERWFGAEGQLRVRTVFEAPIFFRPGDEAAFDEAGLATLYGEGVTSDETFEQVGADELAVADLPTDPGELRARMLADLDAAGNASLLRPVRMLELGASLLQAPDATPALRAAALRVLAEEDGVDVTEAETPDGSVVEVSVSYETEAARFVRSLLFEAATSHLAKSSLLARDALPGGVPAGTVIRLRINAPGVTVASLEAVPADG